MSKKIISFATLALTVTFSAAFADQAGTVPALTPTAPAGTANASAAQSMEVPSVIAHPFYVGIITGYGNTNWNRLVAEDSLSGTATPSQADGQGALIGGLVGYDFNQYLGVEAQFIRFPNADLNFSTPNIYNDMTHMTSMTNYAGMMFKASAPFDNNTFAGFGEIGYAVEMVSDVLANRHDFRPTFGLGMSYFWLPHWTVTAAFNYTPGTGVASEQTSGEYIPYLYSGQLILAYRI